MYESKGKVEGGSDVEGMEKITHINCKKKLLSEENHAVDYEKSFKFKFR